MSDEMIHAQLNYWKPDREADAEEHTVQSNINTTHLRELQGWACGVQDNRKFKDFFFLICISFCSLNTCFRCLFLENTLEDDCISKEVIALSTGLPDLSGPILSWECCSEDVQLPGYLQPALHAETKAKTWTTSVTTQISNKIITAERNGHKLC